MSERAERIDRLGTLSCDAYADPAHVAAAKRRRRGRRVCPVPGIGV
jgi:hypothetical protein